MRQRIRSLPGQSSNIDIKGVNQKIAAMLGVSPDQILINDLKVNPLSHQTYIAVSRGQRSGCHSRHPENGRQWKDGRVLSEIGEICNGESGRCARIEAGRSSWKNPEGFVNGNPRSQSITDMAYVDGKVVVAGVSNAEFASDLRYIPFRSRTAERGTGVQI